MLVRKFNRQLDYEDKFRKLDPYFVELRRQRGDLKSQRFMLQKEAAQPTVFMPSKMLKLMEGSDVK